MKTVTATEAKNRLGALMAEVTSTNQPVLIEVRGHPNAALISATEFERLKVLDRLAKTADVLRLMEEIRLNATPIVVRQITDEMSDEEVDQIIADQLTEARREGYRHRARQRQVAEQSVGYDAADDDA
jgi:prevent-host-death family protein